VVKINNFFSRGALYTGSTVEIDLGQSEALNAIILFEWTLCLGGLLEQTHVTRHSSKSEMYWIQRQMPDCLVSGEGTTCRSCNSEQVDIGNQGYYTEAQSLLGAASLIRH
jgi:hypothetical protein